MDERKVNSIIKSITPNGVARCYLRFKHKHEFGWELIEGFVILVVYALASIGRKHVSHDIEVGADATVILVLVVKVASAICAHVSPRTDNADTAGAGAQ